jgi:hypothetical protein
MSAAILLLGYFLTRRQGAASENMELEVAGE